MKFLNVVFCGLIACGLALPAAAFAQGTGFRPPVDIQRSQQGQQGAPAQPAPRRDMRDGGGMGMGQGERGHMSPDERRKLRQDIQDAGKDIYRSPRQGRAEGRRSERR